MMYTAGVSEREQRFCVSGMSCSACSARVERAVGQLSGVRQVQVNLLTGSMLVRYGAEQTEQSIIHAVEAVGYGARVAQGKQRSVNTTDKSHALKQRFLLSLLLLLPLVAVHHAWHGEVSGIVQCLLCLPILWLNRHFFINGVKSALKGGANMDTLVALGATAAMVDGLVNFCLHHRGSFYFESAGMILTLITLGKWLESRATGRTGAALKKLLALLPQNATVLKNGEPHSVPADAVQVGDTVLVRAGDRVPVDGTVTEGASAVDESALTGESLPAEKYAGCCVYAGSINRNGVLHVRADKTRAQSSLSHIIDLVEQASSGKAPIARIADRISAVFVPIVVGIAVLTAAAWVLAGAEISFAVSCAIAVLVISCPCALGLATPVAIMVGMGKEAERGILFRSGEALESLSRATHMLLDKTGTITTGKACVTDVLPAPGHSEAELLQLAATLEAAGNHPLAEAISAGCRAYTPQPTTEHSYLPGRGICARVGGILCAAGNEQLMQQCGISPDTAATTRLAEAGKTPIYIARGAECLGILAVADPPQPQSHAAVAALQQAGLRVCMLTGDNSRTAQAIARQVGIDDVHAELLPQDKEQHVRRLQEAGHKVAMVGDGINDAPALTRADAGIAIGAGTDIAMESAGIILVRSVLTDAVAALQLSRAVVRNIRQNFFWALLYNCLAIPLAAGAFYPLFGLQLHPAVAAAAMGMSSFCVVTNALRLRHFTPTIKQTMDTIIIKVEGMMCPHCEAHVTKALCALPGVLSCKADHKAGTVTLTTNGSVELSTLHHTIREQGYTVL